MIIHVQIAVNGKMMFHRGIQPAEAATIKSGFGF